MTTPFDQPSTLATTDPEGGDGAYSFDGKPDRWKRYRLPHPETGKADGFTRATTFAKSISDTYSLNMWALRMGGKGLAMRPDLLMQVASTPAEDREKLNNLMEQAKDAAGAKIGANLGTALHAFSEAVDRGEDPNIPPPYRPHLAAYTALLEEYGLTVLDIERVVLCTEYDEKGVAGTLDRVVRFTRDITVKVPGGSHTFRKGTVAILDLKTGKDLSYGWLEIAVQLSVYANAKHRWSKREGRWLSQFEGMDTDVALVVHLPATEPGETVKATMYAVDIAAGKEIAELCTKVRQVRKRKNLATALSVIEENPADALVRLTEDMGLYEEPRPPTLMERVAAARTDAELMAIWWDAVKTRQDTRELFDTVAARKNFLLADSAAG